MKDNYKKRIFWIHEPGNVHLGLLGLVASDFLQYDNHPSDTTMWTKEQLFAINKKFIENCGSVGASGEVVFKFKVEGSELVPTDESKSLFDQWFLKEDEINKNLYRKELGEASSG